MHLDEQTAPGGGDIYKVGEIVFGHFEIISFIASGGKGRVYKARDTMRDVIVALKVMLPNVSNTDVVRFQKEARLASKLEHSNIVSISDFRIEDNTPFLVMEYVEGRTLQEILEEQNVLEMEDFIEIFQQITRALIYAHQHGIVHRDLKPSNIIITGDGDDRLIAKILDFGIAKEIDPALGQLTGSNSIVGSPLYLSPEQSKSEPVGFGSDIYSLGCVMWHALTGSPPYQADSVMEVLIMHQNSNPDELESAIQLPANLESIIRLMLSKQSGDRPTLGQVQDILGSIDESNPLTDSRDTSDDTVFDARKRRASPIAIGLITIAVACTTIGTIVMLMGKTDKHVKPSDASKHPAVASTPPDATIALETGDAIANEFRQTKGAVAVDPKGTYLRLRGEGIQQLHQFKNNRKLVEVFISDCKGLTDAQIDVLASMPALTSLLIYNSPLNDLSGLKKLKGLKKLDVSNCMITDNVIEDIAKISSVERINFAYSGSPMDDKHAEVPESVAGSSFRPTRFPPIAALGRMPNLVYINVSNTAISPGEFNALCSMPTITGVKCDECDGVTLTHSQLYRAYPRISFKDTPCFIHSELEKIGGLKAKVPVDNARIIQIANSAIDLIKERYGDNAKDLQAFYIESSWAAYGLSDWSLMEAQARKSLSIARAQKNLNAEVVSLELLIPSLQRSNQVKAAEAAIRQEIPLLLKKYGKDSEMLANRHKDLGKCASLLGDHARASRELQQSIDMYGRIGLVDRAAAERVSLSTSYLMQKQNAKAESECKAALAVARKLPASHPSKPSITVSATTVLASVSLAKQNYNEALKLNAAALKLSKSLRDADVLAAQLGGQRQLILDVRSKQHAK